MSICTSSPQTLCAQHNIKRAGRWISVTLAFEIGDGNSPRLLFCKDERGRNITLDADEWIVALGMARIDHSVQGNVSVGGD